MPVILFGGKPPGAAPSDIAGLKFWLDAAVGCYSDAGSTPSTDTGVVQQWNDQSGQNRHVSQTVAGYKPTWQQTGINGRPCVRFDGTDDYLYRTANDDDDILTVDAKTVFVVWKGPSNLNGTQRPFLFYDGSHSLFYVTEVNTPAGRCVNWDGTSDSADKSGTIASTWVIQTGMHSGGTLYSGLSDTRTASMATTASGNTSFGVNTNIWIRPASAAYYQCDIAEIAYYNVAVSEADRKELETRFAWKYGITIPY